MEFRILFNLIIKLFVLRCGYAAIAVERIMR